MVITAAQSIFLGEQDHRHHTNDDVLGVMGADFPLTYFYRYYVSPRYIAISIDVVGF